LGRVVIENNDILNKYKKTTLQVYERQPEKKICGSLQSKNCQEGAERGSFLLCLFCQQKLFAAGISAIIKLIIKDWPDILIIIGSVDQVRTFAGGLLDRRTQTVARSIANGTGRTTSRNRSSGRDAGGQ
jgi:hypothetical protein